MSEKKSEFIDLKGLLKSYKKNWYWFLASAIACGLVGFLATYIIKPNYEVRANVMLTEETAVSKFLGGGLSGVAQLFGGNSSAEDEAQIMQSHSVVESVVRDLGLNIATFRRYAPKNYQRVIEESPIELTADAKTINLDTLKSTITFVVSLNDNKTASVRAFTPKEKLFKESELKLPATIKTAWGTFYLSATDKFGLPDIGERFKIFVNSPNDAAEDLRKELNIQLAAKHSKIISMMMETENPDFGIEVLNTVIRNYNQRSRAEQQLQNSRTDKLIADRLASIRQELASTESTLAEYKEHKGLGMVEADGKTYYERMGEAEKALTQQQVMTEMARLTLQIAHESAKDNSMIPPMSDNDGSSKLINTYNALVMQRASIEGASKEGNIALQRLDEQIRMVRKNLITSLESAVSASKKLEHQFQSIYNNAKGSVNSIPEVEQSFRKIARQQAIEEQIFVFLLQKQEETQMLFANINPKALVIDNAYCLNEDKSISPALLVAVFILLGLLLPATYIFLKKDF